MLKRKNGKWALVSKKTQRVLAYYKGEGKPSKEWVNKQERRINAFKYGFSESLIEAAYEGNIGMMELIKFHKSANEDQKKLLKKHIDNKNKKAAWNLIQSVSGTKLHKSVSEEYGAGEDGTDKLRIKYQKDTPGQKIKSFTDYVKNK